MVLEKWGVGAPPSSIPKPNAMCMPMAPPRRAAGPWVPHGDLDACRRAPATSQTRTPRLGAADSAPRHQPGTASQEPRTFLFALDLVFLPLFARGVSIWGPHGCGLHGIRAQARRREGGSLALGHSHTKCARLLSSSGQSLWLTLV